MTQITCSTSTLQARGKWICMHTSKLSLALCPQARRLASKYSGRYVHMLFEPSVSLVNSSNAQQKHAQAELRLVSTGREPLENLWYPLFPKFEGTDPEFHHYSCDFYYAPFVGTAAGSEFVAAGSELSSPQTSKQDLCHYSQWKSHSQLTSIFTKQSSKDAKSSVISKNSYGFLHYVSEGWCSRINSSSHVH